MVISVGLGKRIRGMSKITGRLGVYNPDDLNMSSPVFDNVDEMIDAQPVREG